MFAFKVFTSTLVAIMMVSLFYSGYKSDKSGKIVSILFAVVYGLCIIGMWG